MQNVPRIVCPTCGQEYLMAEIFLPSEFIGKPKEIVRTADGKITAFLGEPSNLEEEYICDNCNTKMNIKANISFEVSTKEELEEEYVTTFTKPKKLKLEEETLFND